MSNWPKRFRITVIGGVVALGLGFAATMPATAHDWNGQYYRQDSRGSWVHGSSSRDDGWRYRSDRRNQNHHYHRRDRRHYYRTQDHNYRYDHRGHRGWFRDERSNHYRGDYDRVSFGGSGDGVGFVLSIGH